MDNEKLNKNAKELLFIFTHELFVVLFLVSLLEYIENNFSFNISAILGLASMFVFYVLYTWIRKNADFSDFNAKIVIGGMFTLNVFIMVCIFRVISILMTYL